MTKEFKGAYDDEPTEEELKLLSDHTGSAELPPADENNEPPAPAPAPAPEPAPALEPDPADGQDGDDHSGDDEVSQFLERHKGKSTEEIARIALQQQKRANRAEFSSRATTDKLTTVLERIQTARDARLTDIAAARTAFQERVATDPDAALLEARESTLTAEEQRVQQEAEAAAFNARAEAAIDFAGQLIPDFPTAAPKLRSFGLEMGFTPEEVDSVADGRQLVMLHLGNIAANLMKAGVIDTAGRFIGVPESVVPISGDAGAPPPRGTGFQRQPGRGAATAKTIDARLADVSAMSDADFAKMSDADLNALLREAELS